MVIKVQEAIIIPQEVFQTKAWGVAAWVEDLKKTPKDNIQWVILLQECTKALEQQPQRLEKLYRLE